MDLMLSGMFGGITATLAVAFWRWLRPKLIRFLLKQLMEDFVDNIKDVNFSVLSATDALADDMLTKVTTVGATGTDGAAVGAKVGLLKSPVIYNKSLTLGDLEIADYDGYAISSAVTWGALTHDNQGEAVRVGSSKTFIPTGDDTIGSNVITGAYLVASDGTTLLDVRNFDEAVTVSLTSALTINPAISVLDVE